ncbi:hypothetical protein CCHR01_07694 [Colletotrichum chrysophilum]|uniref:Uncharacterized protein n=1 Tax=Colletotrichum chrysophilum TaxID=1836956 RepID=A0AAD9AL93_9PEZI|nr:hypothetical protein CCHR01_07694 [Colletotrichum chrysophilum]
MPAFTNTLRLSEILPPPRDDPPLTILKAATTSFATPSTSYVATRPPATRRNTDDGTRNGGTQDKRLGRVLPRRHQYGKGGNFICSYSFTTDTDCR